jgi:predicted dehydrogenase
MEAMWTRFQPKSTVIAQLLADGVLGELEVVIADLGFRATFDPEGRMYNPELGGGALLDLGVYPTWFAQFALGAPSAVHAIGSLASTGVDEQVSVTLEHESGADALLSVSLRAGTGGRGLIAGSAARLEVPDFIAPGGFTLVGNNERLEFVDETQFVWRDGLCWQATAVAKHVADGLTEAPEHPLSVTIAQLTTLDAARTAVGYPPA